MSRTFATAGALCLLPAAAFAAEGGDASTGIWHLVNFVLFVALLVYFGRTPVRSFLAERRRDIQHEIDGAGRELADAERRLDECQRRLADLDRELGSLREAVRAQAEAERRRILEEAHAAAERVQRDAAAAIEQEVERARRDLRREAGELAVGLAADLLRERAGSEDRARLLDEFVQRIEHTQAGAGPQPRS